MFACNPHHLSAIAVATVSTAASAEDICIVYDCKRGVCVSVCVREEEELFSPPPASACFDGGEAPARR